MMPSPDFKKGVVFKQTLQFEISFLRYLAWLLLYYGLGN